MRAIYCYIIITILLLSGSISCDKAPLAPKNQVHSIQKVLYSQNKKVHNLFKIAENGDEKTLVKLLKMGSDVNSQDRFGDTILHSAAQWNDTSMLEKVLKFKPNLLLQNKQGQTSLMLAAEESAIEVLQILLGYMKKYQKTKMKSWLNLNDELGNTALYWAVNAQCFHCVKELLKYPVRITKNKEGIDPLLLTKEHHLQGIANLLLKKL